MSYADFLKAQHPVLNTNTTSAANNHIADVKSNTETVAYAPANTSSSLSESISHYSVQNSDTLYSIAKKFKVTVEELKTLNNLQNTNIHAGQTLVVSK